MFNKFRDIVSGMRKDDSAKGMNNNSYRQSVNNSNGQSRNSHSTSSESRPPKYTYNRPSFLALTSDDELSIVLDKTERPILVPRNASLLPCCAGYAEAVNAGKSDKNEDQGHADLLILRVPHPSPRYTASLDSTFLRSTSKSINQTEPLVFVQEATPADPPCIFAFFSIFDGHAGTGAALYARHNLHLHVKDRLSAVLPVIRNLIRTNPDESPPDLDSPNNNFDTAPHLNCTGAGFADCDMTCQHQVSLDELIVGALEQAFVSLDQQMEKDLECYDISGGCTAVAALGFRGKLYVANAGDSRAIVVHNESPILMSIDHTPQNDRQRILTIAKLSPHLLGDEFHFLEFPKRIQRKDIGKKVLYRHSFMTGWGEKKITKEDLRFPLIYGEGKRTRLMSIIGVCRGFGDFKLRVYDTNLFVKPFMTPAPDVKIFSAFGKKQSTNNHAIPFSKPNIESNLPIIPDQPCCPRNSMGQIIVNVSSYDEDSESSGEQTTSVLLTYDSKTSKQRLLRDISCDPIAEIMPSTSPSNIGTSETLDLPDSQTNDTPRYDSLFLDDIENIERDFDSLTSLAFTDENSSYASNVAERKETSTNSSTTNQDTQIETGLLETDSPSLPTANSPEFLNCDTNVSTSQNNNNGNSFDFEDDLDTSPVNLPSHDPLYLTINENSLSATQFSLSRKKKGSENESSSEISHPDDQLVSYNHRPNLGDTLPRHSISNFDQEMNSISVNDVMIMATDGLWDICSVDEATRVVSACLKKCSITDKTKYNVAAQELVMYARGVLKDGNWRTKSGGYGSYDDISVFVVPLRHLLYPSSSPFYFHSETIPNGSSGFDSIFNSYVMIQ